MYTTFMMSRDYRYFSTEYANHVIISLTNKYYNKTHKHAAGEHHCCYYYISYL